MAIDRSGVSAAFGNMQRIGAVRRVDRDAPPPRHGDKNSRDGGDGHPGSPPAPPDLPHDIIEVSPVPAPGEETARPQPHLPASPAPVDTERHLDIQV